MINQKEIQEAIDTNNKRTDVKSVSFVLSDKKGNQFRKNFSCVCLTPTYFCLIHWDRHGIKYFGPHYSYSNVERIEFNFYTDFKEVTLVETDINGKETGETKLKIGKD